MKRQHIAEGDFNDPVFQKLLSYLGFICAASLLFSAVLAPSTIPDKAVGLFFFAFLIFAGIFFRDEVAKKDLAKALAQALSQKPD